MFNFVLSVVLTLIATLIMAFTGWWILDFPPFAFDFLEWWAMALVFYLWVNVSNEHRNK